MEPDGTAIGSTFLSSGSQEMNDFHFLADEVWKVARAAPKAAIVSNMHGQSSSTKMISIVYSPPHFILFSLEKKSKRPPNQGLSKKYACFETWWCHGFPQILTIDANNQSSRRNDMEIIPLLGRPSRPSPASWNLLLRSVLATLPENGDH